MRGCICSLKEYFSEKKMETYDNDGNMSTSSVG